MKSWSKTIAVLALSSGEPELMAMVRASTEALGLRALYRGFGLEMKIGIRSDATAAIGIVARVGLGRVRHLAVSDLWIQAKARSGEIIYTKINGKINYSDALTKPVEAQTLEAHLRSMGTVVLQGRAGIAPRAKLLDGEIRDA